MNKYNQVIPNYTFYSQIKYGSNLIGSKYLVDISGYCPLVIGHHGKKAMLSLYIKEVDNQILPIVKDNHSLVDQVTCRHDNSTCRIEVTIIDRTYQEHTLVNFSYGTRIPTVTKLDLRPLGVSVYLDGDILHAGNLRFSGNTMMGGEAFIGVK